ncbi:hypothetical protein SAMN06265222_11635 [Neorhodopirellula lusitana]|uniref:DUF4405 domain-containing protein n=1 Tax=Neorhodopirellula lusitana TaxID=445327 RepID=A0ABY1QNB6_9BACT|nr:hypothetical protein SAMN06265222_11635 [Neorhodopirellula lusitana]
MPRRFVSLLTALTFAVVAVTGVLAFVQSFSLQIVGMHALMGFIFIGLIALHVGNNLKPLTRYSRSTALWVCLAVTATSTSAMWWQPGPIKMLLGMSGNLGPAMSRFERSGRRMTYHYSPADFYKMELVIKLGNAYQLDNPPSLAIWLENQGGYHIKTLHQPDAGKVKHLPYWDFKVRGWEKAKLAAAEGNAGRQVAGKTAVDGVSAATPNGSFDPADYILPANPDQPMPYKLLIEIDQFADAHGTYDDQPSLVYAVELDNSRPQTFQLLELIGYPQREPSSQDDGDSESWSLYYVNDEFGSALELVDSALLTIERQKT